MLRLGKRVEFLTGFRELLVADVCVTLSFLLIVGRNPSNLFVIYSGLSEFRDGKWTCPVGESDRVELLDIEVGEGSVMRV